jgi:hypothetical protein
LFIFRHPAELNNNASPGRRSSSTNGWQPTPAYWRSGGQFDDRFEIYNPNGVTVDLTGYSLTDTPTNAASQTIAGTTILPTDFFWSGPTTRPVSTPPMARYPRISTQPDREAIGLFAPGSLVDSVTLARKRTMWWGWPDGSANIYFMNTPTPRSANDLGNTFHSRLSQPFWTAPQSGPHGARGTEKTYRVQHKMI